MNEKFKNKYRTQSTRLQNWDYSWNGRYFITICTKNRRHFLGKIKNVIMYHSKIGQLAQKYWNEIPAHFHDVKLGEFMVMPSALSPRKEASHFISY